MSQIGKTHYEVPASLALPAVLAFPVTQVPPAHQPIILLIEEGAGKLINTLALCDRRDDLIMTDGDEVEDCGDFRVADLAVLAVALVKVL